MFDEPYRFEWMIRSLIPVALEEEVDPVWEWRTSAMSLMNALANSPDEVEERSALRGEFQRRGLGEILEVSVDDMLWSLEFHAGTDHPRPCARSHVLPLSFLKWGYTLKNDKTT